MDKPACPPYMWAQSGLVGRDGPGQPAQGRPTYEAAQTSYQLADGQDGRRPMTWTDSMAGLHQGVRAQRGDFTVGVDYKIDNKSAEPVECSSTVSSSDH